MPIKKQIAVIYPAGMVKINDEKKEERYQKFQDLDFEITEIYPQISSLDGCTSAPALERATQLSYALTKRNISIIIAARGGVGTTELIPYLENLLPPIISDKMLIGFSDISFLGVYLAKRFPNLKYVHGQNFYAEHLFKTSLLDQKALIDLMHGFENEYTFQTAITYPAIYNKNKNILFEGECIPVNLSLAESLAACPFIQFENDNILFLEDCNEYLYRIIRKLDSLINSNLLKNTKAIVLGSFLNILDSNENKISRQFILNLFARKTRLPVLDLPIFGHEEHRFPLLMNSKVIIEQNTNSCKIIFKNKLNPRERLSTNFPANLYTNERSNHSKEATKIHLTGIGGTGMAQVAGFFVKAGYIVTGSDGPIYPPMDKLIGKLKITPDLGFNAENIKKHSPDLIVLANVVSRLNASLKKNEELEEILAQNIPVLSFPSALRKYFLHSSRNIIISGTHGKTTTSSLVTFLLDSLNYNPSFLIGGSPVNFDAGFALHSDKIFVLEGDEYDSAFFDKGPKFLHYEPKISLINNIEFDHADIYNNVEAIEAEFTRLAYLTKDRGGYIVANLDDKRVHKIMPQTNRKIIGFSKDLGKDTLYKTWKLKSFKTHSNGTEIFGLTPENKEFHFKSQIFGEHNALNAIASMAVLHANQLLEMEESSSNEALTEYGFLERACSAMQNFKGVKRRFELLAEQNNISIFDDFAHHPTAIETTINAFRDYTISAKKGGSLIICFDPKNATMRRNIFQKELAHSLRGADRIYLGKVPQDLRMNPEETLNGPAVAKDCGEKAKYFEDNEQLLISLKAETKPGDTVVFMSSGSFDGIPHKFANLVKNG